MQLARICLRQARATKDAKLTAVLRRMAKEYQRRAAQLEGAEAWFCSQRQ
jgi:hypothetical protein